MTGTVNSTMEKKAKVAPLYVRRNVTNAQSIIDHFKGQGFDKTVPPEEMHVTVAHSSDPLDWTAAGDHFDTIHASGGDRRVKPLGDKGAQVLHFENGDLQDRWQQFKDAGASWDYDGYQPHITISYANEADTSDMMPYEGPIILGPEIFEPLDTDGSYLDNMVEKGHRFRLAKIDETHGLVFGWAIVCTKDGEPYYDLNIDVDEDAGTYERVPENIPENAMLKAATKFASLSERPGNEMHAGPDSGQFVFLFPLTTDIAKAMGISCDRTGLMVAYKPTPEVLQKFRSGEYSGFSIEGTRLKIQEHE